MTQLKKYITYITTIQDIAPLYKYIYHDTTTTTNNTQ